MAKVLRQFSDSNKYVILPELKTLCKPSAKIVMNEDGIDKCEPLKKYGLKDMMQFEVEYGGKTLRTRLAEAKPFPFFDFMRQMLELGSFMVLHGCIHNDIHSNNIVLGPNPRLIDFGRSYMYNSIDKELVTELTGVEYNPSLGQISPEITMHHGIDHRLTVKHVIDDIVKEKSGLANAEKVLGISRTRQAAALRDFWENSKSVQARDWVTFYNLYWPKVDSWSIGANLLSALKKLLLTKGFVESREWIQKQGIIKEVLRGLMQADPRARLDCVNALAIYDPMNALLSEPSGRAWLNNPQA